MFKREYIGVSITEFLSDLVDITGNHTEAEALLDEVIDAYQIEYYEEQQVLHGEKTREQVDKEREKRRSSRNHTNRLRRNMIAAGRAQPLNTSPHHIVACDDSRAIRARALLTQVGIGIDDEANGVFLPMYKIHTPHPDMPNAYAHLPVHTDIYYLNITAALTVESNNPEGIEDVLRDIAEQLTDGTFPLHEKAEV